MLLISSTPTSTTTSGSGSGSSGGSGSGGSGSSSGNDSNTSLPRVAKVMNKGNQVIAVYTHDNNGDSCGYGGSGNGGSGNGSGYGVGGSKMDPHGNVQHSWRFDGLSMTFDPHTFEIKVRVRVGLG